MYFHSGTLKSRKLKGFWWQFENIKGFRRYYTILKVFRLKVFSNTDFITVRTTLLLPQVAEQVTVPAGSSGPPAVVPTTSGFWNCWKYPRNIVWIFKITVINVFLFVFPGSQVFPPRFARQKNRRATLHFWTFQPILFFHSEVSIKILKCFEIS